MPAVSVIVPNYNHAPYLDQRLRSVREQTFEDFEIIFLDDASPDNSREVFKAHARDPRIAHVIFNERNSGSPFKQWNKGLRLARGEFIWIAESDDDCERTLLGRLVELLRADPNLGLACCQSLRLHEEGRGDLLPLFARGNGNVWRQSFTMKGDTLCAREFVLENRIPNASGVVFRRGTAAAAGFADESWRLCGDWRFWVDILRRSSIAFLAEPLNLFRTHRATARHSASRSGLDVLEHYRMSQYVRTHVPVDPAMLATARWLAARRWGEALRRTGARLPAGLHARILLHAHRFDPLAAARLAKAWRTLAPSA